MKRLEVRKIDGRYPASQVIDVYHRYGIVVLKGFLAPETRDRLRSIVERRFEKARSAQGILKVPEFPRAEFLVGDILALRELEDTNFIFFQTALLEAARVVLGSKELIYWGDSSIQMGEAARGFHKDNVARADGSHDDWAGDYGLVRCAFYFQDHTENSGGLKVRLASHDIPDHLTGTMADVATVYGDLVLWSMRLTHSGNNRRLRVLPGLTLHPRLEAALPSWLVAPEQQRRISAFCAFGRPGSHADRYLANMRARDSDYHAYFQRARRSLEAVPLLASYGVSFVQPATYYGELDDAPD